MAEQNNKTNTLFYHSWLDTFEDLTDEEIGQLTIAVLKYDQTGEIPAFSDRTVKAIFKMLKSQIDANNEAYAKRCEMNQSNGKKGGRPRKKEADEETEKPNGFSEPSEKPNGYSGFFEKTEKNRKNPIDKSDKSKSDKNKSDMNEKVTECVTVTNADAGASCDTHTCNLVRQFFRDNGFTSDPDVFINYNIGRGNGEIFRSKARWQAVAKNWEKKEQDFHPPDPFAALDEWAKGGD